MQRAALRRAEKVIAKTADISCKSFAFSNDFCRLNDAKPKERYRNKASNRGL